MCYTFETFKPPLGRRHGSPGVTSQADDDDRYTVSEWSFSSLSVLMNLMWYVAIPASPTGSDTTLNADGPTQTGGICHLKGS